jgi:hypothetical protein
MTFVGDSRALRLLSDIGLRGGAPRRYRRGVPRRAVARLQEQAETEH